MDTREKRIAVASLRELLAQGKWLVAAGLFDPLTADVAHHLTSLAEQHPGRRFLVLVMESQSAHLPAEARAALVGALRTVSNVAVGSRSDLPAASDSVLVLTDAERDRAHTDSFVELVLQKQKVLEKAVCS